MVVDAIYKHKKTGKKVKVTKVTANEIYYSTMKGKPLPSKFFKQFLKLYDICPVVQSSSSGIQLNKEYEYIPDKNITTIPLNFRNGNVLFKVYKNGVYQNSLEWSMSKFLSQHHLKSGPMFNDKQSCQHNWEDLVLFSSTIKYCRKCDSSTN